MSADVDEVVAVLQRGGVVLLPTDTVYGIAALPGHEDRLRELKGRPERVPIAVLVADAGQAAAATGRPLPPAAQRYAEQHWPGPLTLVLATADGATLGVRCPDDGLLRAVAARVGPLATTSANRHGEPTPATAAEAAASLAPPGPDLVVDGGPCTGEASTVLDVTGEEPVVIRRGPVDP